MDEVKEKKILGKRLCTMSQSSKAKDEKLANVKKVREVSQKLVTSFLITWCIFINSKEYLWKSVIYSILGHSNSAKTRNSSHEGRD